MKPIFFGAGLWALLHGVLAHASLDKPVEEPPEIMRAYAETGDPVAQFNLALVHHKGEGGKPDLAQALVWYRKAAVAGFPNAQYALGLLLRKGDGVAKDEKEAVKWFHAAAGQGFFPAQKMMIECYARGLGVAKNPVQALTWDFLARRSLHLRYEQIAPDPPRPARLRADGFAEYTSPAGALEAIGPDGTVEKTNSSGVRSLHHLDGSTTIVTSSGVRETTYPDGRWLHVHPDGLRERGFPSGVVLKEYTDGRKVAMDRGGNVETQFPDGTRQMESDAKTKSGRRVRVMEKFDKEGQRLLRRISDEVETVEELPDGTRLAETRGEDEQGRTVRVIDSYDGSGRWKERRVVREDGVERSGEETWKIRRWRYARAGNLEKVSETYGAGNAIESGEVLESRPGTAPVSAAIPLEKARTPSPVLTGPPPPRARTMEEVVLGALNFPPARGVGTRFARTKVAIDTQLAELAALERQAQYFAGATDADYERARASAQRFVLRLPSAPQKPAAAQGAARLTLRGIPPPLPGFVRLATDRSAEYPLGLYGRAAIKLHPWQHTETEHFVVHYIDPKEAYSVMGDIECTFINVIQALQLDPLAGRRKSHVFIFPDAAAWEAFKKPLSLPADVVGFAYKAELYLGARDDREKYLHTLCHEAVHAVVSRYYPAHKWPLWLTEGFAEYVSTKQMELRSAAKAASKSTASAATLAPARKAEWEIEVDRVLYRTGYGNGVETIILANGVRVNSTALFYAESERCVRTLMEKLPPRSFAYFANLVFAGNSMPVCLGETYGAVCDSEEKFGSLVNGRP